VSRWVKVLLGVLLTLVVLLVVADRVGLIVAERSAESKLGSYAQFVDKPNVVIHGIPFLTQAICGDYDDIQITSGAVQLDQMTGTNLNVHLRGAHIPLGDLLGGSVKQIPVDKVDGTVVVPYDALIARSGVPGLHLASEGSQVVATGQITLPGTSLSLNITAKGTLDVADGKVRLNVSDVTANGATLPSAVTDQVATLVSNAITLPKLPFQLTTARVTADPAGARITATATGVVLKSAP